jgi:N-acetylneuraminic acid mutarotase
MKPIFKLLLSLAAGFQSLETTAAEFSNGWKRLPDLPDPIGVAGAFAGVSGGALIVAGGANFPDKMPWEGGKKVWYDTIWALEKPDGEWKTVGKLPKPNGYGVSVTLTNGVLCIGGGDATANFTDVFLMSYKNGKVSFETWPSLPRPCANACGVGNRFEVFVAGGVESPTSTTAMATFWSLSLTNQSAGWRGLPTWPGPPRQLAVAGDMLGDFFLCGGTSLAPGDDGKAVRTYLRDAYSYREQQGWKRLADAPFSPTAAPSPAIALGWVRMFVFGGDDAPSANPQLHTGFRNEVLSYVRATDKWQVDGTNPAPRVTAPLVYWNDSYVIVSGEVRRGVRSREVWMWTP